MITPHRSTTYVDVAYCYRPSSVVWRGLSVCLSVCHLVSPAKTAEAIEMPFVLKTWVGPRNHLLDKTERFQSNTVLWDSGHSKQYRYLVKFFYLVSPNFSLGLEEVLRHVTLHVGLYSLGYVYS